MSVPHHGPDPSEDSDNQAPHIIRVPHDIPNFPPGAINTNSPAEPSDATPRQLPSFSLRATGNTVIAEEENVQTSTSRRPSSSSIQPPSPWARATQSPTIPEEPEIEGNQSIGSKQPLRWSPFVKKKPPQKSLVEEHNNGNGNNGAGAGTGAGGSSSVAGKGTGLGVRMDTDGLGLSGLSTGVNSDTNVDVVRWLNQRDPNQHIMSEVSALTEKREKQSNSEPHHIHSPFLVFPFLLLLFLISAASLALSSILIKPKTSDLFPPTIYALALSSLSTLYALWSILNNLWGIPFPYRGFRGKMIIAFFNVLNVVTWSSGFAIEIQVVGLPGAQQYKGMAEDNAWLRREVLVVILAIGLLAWTGWLFFELARVFVGIKDESSSMTDREGGRANAGSASKAEEMEMVA